MNRSLRGWAIGSVLGVVALMLITQILVVDMLRGRASLEPLGYLVWAGLTLFSAGAVWLMWKARRDGFRGAISEVLWLVALAELAVTGLGWVVYYNRY